VEREPAPPPPAAPTPVAARTEPAGAPAAPGIPPPAGSGYRNPVFAAPGAPDPGVLDVGSARSEYFVA
jgi:hypothetical protein